MFLAPVAAPTGENRGTPQHKVLRAERMSSDCRKNLNFSKFLLKFSQKLSKIS